MDGLQLQRLAHDENAGVGPSLNNKPGGLQQQSGLKPGPLSSRKAFGNITNKSQQQQDGGSGAEQSAAKPRRAFGELSTNRPAQLQAQQRSDGGKPAALKPARQAFGQVQQQAQQSAPAAVAPLQQQQDLAAAYAAGGVERYAGKTWQQLEEEREVEEEARAASAARRLASRLAGWRVGGSTLKVAADEDEDEDSLLAPQQRPAAAVGPSTAAPAASADPLAGLLGDDDLFGATSGSPLDLLPDVAEGATPPSAAATPLERRQEEPQPCSPDSQPW